MDSLIVATRIKNDKESYEDKLYMKYHGISNERSRLRGLSQYYMRLMDHDIAALAKLSKSSKLRRKFREHNIKWFRTESKKLLDEEKELQKQEAEVRKLHINASLEAKEAKKYYEELRDSLAAE